MSDKVAKQAAHTADPRLVQEPTKAAPTAIKAEAATAQMHETTTKQDQALFEDERLQAEVTIPPIKEPETMLEPVAEVPIPAIVHEDVHRQIIEQLPRDEAERDPELVHIADVPVEAVRNYDIGPDAREIALVVAPPAAETAVTAETEPDETEPDEAGQSEAEILDGQPELADAAELEPDATEDALLTDEAAELPVDEDEYPDDLPTAEISEILPPIAADGEPADIPELEVPPEEPAAASLAPEIPAIVWDPEADEPVEVPAVIAEPVVQLNEAIAQLDTETAHEVHQAAKEAETVVESVIHMIEAAEAAGAKVEITEETVEQLVEAVQQLYVAAGINIEQDEVKRLVLELLNQPETARLSEEQLEDDQFAERGTLEKLQWFQSYLKNLKWQTNLMHLVLGKFALTSVRELQAA